MTGRHAIGGMCVWGRGRGGGGQPKQSQGGDSLWASKLTGLTCLKSVSQGFMEHEPTRKVGSS